LKTTKAELIRSLVISSGLIALLVLLQLYVGGTIKSKIAYEIISVVVIMVMWLLLSATKKRKKPEIKNENDFETELKPIPLGTLYFGFALILWTIWASEQAKEQPIKDFGILIIACFVSVISLVLFIATYSEKVRKYFSRIMTPNLAGLTVIISIFSFVYSVLSSPLSFPKNYLPIVEVVIGFGFVWVVTIMLSMIGAAKNELMSLMIIVSFIFLGTERLCHPNSVSIISGIYLIIIGVLAYLVVTKHLNLPEDVV
jgi:hypothetical protein